MTATSTDLAAVLDAKLRDDTLRVPPYPAVASQLQRMVHEERFGVQEVSNLIAADAALAALVLKHASSAGLGMGGATPTLGVAVFRLGVDAVIRLAIASTVGAAAGAQGPLAGLRRDLWRRALIAAALCRELGPARRTSPEVAFLAGLLHDFGALVTLSTIEGIARGGSLPVLAAAKWKELVEQFHVPVGIAVARRWQLPESIASAIEHHHDPSAASPVDRPLVELVGIVDTVIATLDRAPAGGLAALGAMRALTDDDRRRIIAAIPTIAEHLASFEAALPSAKAAVAAPSAIAAEPTPGLYPVDFVVDAKGTTSSFKAIGISEEAIELHGRAPLRPDWVATLTLRTDKATWMILATVESCRQHRDGYIVTARPFGLAPGDRSAWQRIVERARTAMRARVAAG